MSLVDVANNMNNMDTVKLAITLAKHHLSDSIWKAAIIEGLGTTFVNTESILDNLPVCTTRDEVLFVVNMREAWRYLFDNLDCDNDWMILREFNCIAGINLIDGRGALRRREVSISGTTWTPTLPIREDVYESIKALNSIEDDVDRALSYFCYIARTQLFVDGNKRVAQLMANKILIESGVGIFSIPIDCIQSFKALLIEFYETGNDIDIKEFFRCKCILYV